MFEKRKYTIFFSSVALTIIGVLALPGFSHAASTQDIVAKYNAALKTGDKVNVLIVPGHDDDFWGTQFGDIREGDLTVSIGQYLYNYLKADPKLNVTITRTQMGYTDRFKNYFADHRQEILNFISTSQSNFKAQIQTGAMQNNEIVPHATANSEVALRLYGINKWANENNIDFIIHVHINDSGGRANGEVGKYTGFSMYVPDKQYSNATVSADLGKAVFGELLKKNTPSDYPPEAAGVIPDQQLIAIGAANTLKPAATLIEYGYIYEKKFLNIDNRDALTSDLAYQTFLGIHSFLGDRAKFPAVKTVSSQPMTSPTKPGAVVAPAKSLYLPHTWSKTIGQGSKETADVNALQAALTKSGVYDCGVTGIFGPCTVRGVKAFQQKYNLEQTGTLGPKTRAKLNAMYSK